MENITTDRKIRMNRECLRCKKYMSCRGNEIFPCLNYEDKEGGENVRNIQQRQ